MFLEYSLSKYILSCKQGPSISPVYLYFLIIFLALFGYLSLLLALLTTAVIFRSFVIVLTRVLLGFLSQCRSVSQSPCVSWGRGGEGWEGRLSLLSPSDAFSPHHSALRNSTWCAGPSVHWVLLLLCLRLIVSFQYTFINHGFIGT